MTKKILPLLLLICLAELAEAQSSIPRNFDAFIENAISLSEQALYKAEFDEALNFVERSYYEKFSSFENKHKISLSIQNIRVQSFRARLHQTPFNLEEHLNKLLNFLPEIETIEDEHVKAKYFTMLSALYRSNNLDSCILYENKALVIFNNQADYKSLAELQATQVSRELDGYFHEDKKEEALAMIPRLREEIDFSSKHSKYALAYNTRHLANIYRIYDIDQKEALKLYKQSLDLREEIGFKPFITASYYSLGEVYFNLEMYESAMEAYHKSVEMGEKVHFIRYTILPLIRLGDVYSAIGDSIQAKEFYVNAIKAASKNKFTNKGIDGLIEKIIGIEK